MGGGPAQAPAEFAAAFPGAGILDAIVVGYDVQVRVAVADLTEEANRREDLLALAGRVRCVRGPELETRWGEKIGEAEVRIRTREGLAIGARALPPGGPGCPMEDSDRKAEVGESPAWGVSDLQPSHRGNS